MENNFEDIYEIRQIEKFNNKKIPDKIRKTELLKDAGLPIPDTNYYSRLKLDSLREVVTQQITKNNKPLIIRVACIPPKLSMPVFYIEKQSDIEEIFNNLKRLLDSDQSIESFILQDTISEDDAKDKISGRIVFEDNSTDLEIFVELYKGARSTGVLNKLNPSDVNYQRLEKKLGGFMKKVTELSEKSNITINEIKDIYNIFERYKDNMELVKNIILKSNNGDKKDMSVSLEFSYINGNIVFIDIDM